MKRDIMEIEDKLKEAAKWHPKTEMPVGLERRALAQSRPPLRPIGLARPATAFSTLLAAATCAFLVSLAGTPSKIAPASSPSPSAVAPPVPESRPVSKGKTTPPQRVLLPTKAAPVRSAPKPQRKRILVDADNPIIVQSRVPVDEPVYAPAYYAQPSEDGTRVELSPVVASLGDPDVIYTPKE